MVVSNCAFKLNRGTSFGPDTTNSKFKIENSAFDEGLPSFCSDYTDVRTLWSGRLTIYTYSLGLCERVNIMPSNGFTPWPDVPQNTATPLLPQQRTPTAPVPQTVLSPSKGPNAGSAGSKTVAVAVGIVVAVVVVAAVVGILFFLWKTNRLGGHTERPVNVPVDDDVAVLGEDLNHNDEEDLNRNDEEEP
jgi:hypothetical protein